MYHIITCVLEFVDFRLVQCNVVKPVNATGSATCQPPADSSAAVSVRPTCVRI